MLSTCRPGLETAVSLDPEHANVTVAPVPSPPLQNERETALGRNDFGVKDVDLLGGCQRVAVGVVAHEPAGDEHQHEHGR